MTTSEAAVALAKDLKAHPRELVTGRLRLDIADAVEAGQVTLRASGSVAAKVSSVPVQPEDQVLVARTGERGEVVIGAVAPPDIDEPPGWYELSSEAPDLSYLTRVAGQWVWRQLERYHATSYGLATDGTATGNRSALLRCATDATEAGALTDVDAGEYALDAVTLPGALRLAGRGSDRTTFTRATGGNTPTLAVGGAIGASTALSVNAAAGDASVTTATNPGLASGDLVHLTSTRTVGTSSGPVGYELAHVAAVSGSGPYTITLQEALLHPFATADGSAIAKVTPTAPRLEGFAIRVTGAAQARGVQLYATEGAVVEDYQISDYYANGLDLRISSGGRVSGYRADDPTATTSGLGYGINVREGSRGMVIEDFEGHRNRHLIVITGASSYITVRDGRGYDSYFGDFDSHGHECRYLTWVDCHAHTDIGGFNAGNASYSWDADIEYRGCTSRGAIAGAADAHFRFVQGATRITLVNPRTHLGTNGIYLNGASEIDIDRGRLRNHTRGIDGNDSTGVMIDGTVVQDTTSDAIRSQGASAGNWKVHNVTYVSCAAGETLAGVNPAPDTWTR